MVILILWVKIDDVIEGADINLERGWHGKFSSVEKQGYNIIHAWDFCNMWEHLGLDVPS